MVASQLPWSPHSYENNHSAQECYQSVVVSSTMLSPTRPLPQLVHKQRFAYQCPPRPYGEGVTWYRLVRRPKPRHDLLSTTVHFS